MSDKWTSKTDDFGAPLAVPPSEPLPDVAEAMQLAEAWVYAAQTGDFFGCKAALEAKVTAIVVERNQFAERVEQLEEDAGID